MGDFEPSPQIIINEPESQPLDLPGVPSSNENPPAYCQSLKSKSVEVEAQTEPTR